MIIESNEYTKLKTAELSSFLGQTSQFRPIRPHQWIWKNRRMATKTSEYKLHKSEVRGDVL